MIIKSRNVFINGSFAPACLRLQNGRISALLPYDSEPCREDFGDARILPGFIDIHTHGAFGIDSNSASPAELARWAKELPREGVTAFLPTTITDTLPRLKAALAAIAEAAGSTGAAEILGAHLEGPFLAPSHRGAHPKELLQLPCGDIFRELWQASRGSIRVMTMAPELPGGEELLQQALSLGVRVSIGHSACSYREALAFAEAGAAAVTHLYNGMSPLHHRDPGLLGAALTDSRLYGELIADGLHSHPAAAAIFYKLKAPHRAIMITDSLAPKGCPPGEGYRVGDAAVTLHRDGLARLADGTIAGSTLAMNKGLQLMVEKAGVPFEQALASCTGNPAEYLGLGERKGSLAPGRDADIAVLGEDYSVIAAFCRGMRVV